MPRLTDEDIERHLLEGTKTDELKQELGEELYTFLRAGIADASGAASGTDEFLGFGSDHQPNIYILPGIMGSKLSARSGTKKDLIWFDLADLALGGVAKLKFGEEPKPVFASGTFWSTYGPIRLQLGWRGYRVRFLPFDWRQSVSDIGAKLIKELSGNGPNGAVLVAHSMGGLVARQMTDLDEANLIKKVITIGTPNYGSYSPVQVFRVASDMLNKIGVLDLKHTPSEIARFYLRHFPGLVEMMPDPSKRPNEPYFDNSYWPSGGAKPNKITLSKALKAKTALAKPDSRFHQIIGYGQETVVRAENTGSELEYRLSDFGDGTVPVDLAESDGVDKFYVNDTHAGMLNRPDVARAVHQLILHGQTSVLSKSRPMATFEQESIAKTITDAQARTINAQRHSEIRNAEDILSEFLQPPSLSPYPGRDGPDPFAAEEDRQPRGMDLSRRIGGYPLSVLLRASDTWRGQEKVRPLETMGRATRETDRRLEKYARRKLEQLRQISGAVTQLPPSLQEVVTKAESNPEGALNDLLRERKIGEAEEYVSVLSVKRAPIVSKSVGRIINKYTQRGFGTGFLVAPGVLMTNQHVLPDDYAAQDAAVQFDFELNYREQVMTPEIFELRTDLLYYSNKDLDFALVGVNPVGRKTNRALSDFGYLPLDGGEGKITIGQPVNIIQHPNAEPKQAVFRESTLIDLPANNLSPGAQYSGSPQDVAAHYTGDTKPGSSGSPVFSDAWEVIALHHSGVAVVKDEKFLMKDGTFRHVDDIYEDDDVDWQANEGIRISRITNHLHELVNNRSSKLTASAVDRIKELLSIGEFARRNGHFTRPMPSPVLSQFDDVPRPREAGPSADEAKPAPQIEVPDLATFESLLEQVKNLAAALLGQPQSASGTSGTGKVSVDGAGVAHGSDGLSITYLGDASAPYGVSATTHQRPFDSIVLHHNAPHLTTDWLIRYQITGDTDRGGHFGYHFYIDPSGMIFQGAPLDKRTNHVKSPRHEKRKSFGQVASNNSSIGVTCVQAGPDYRPNGAQIAAQDKLVRALGHYYRIPSRNVFGHGEIQADRNAAEGASQAAKLRAASGTSFGSEGLWRDDNTDDSALEALGQTGAGGPIPAAMNGRFGL